MPLAISYPAHLNTCKSIKAMYVFLHTPLLFDYCSDLLI